MACRGCSSGGDGCQCSVVGSTDGAITFTGTGEPVISPYTPAFHFDEVLGDLTEDTSDCDVLDNPLIPVLLGDGSVVLYQLPCVTRHRGHFGGNAFSFTFLGDTTDTDPGDGSVKFNNATYSSVTQIYVNDQDYDATGILDWLDSFTPASKIRLYSITDPENWADFVLNSITTGTGYRKLNVTYVDHAGALDNDLGNTVLDYAPAASNKKNVIDTGGVYATPVALTASQTGSVILVDDAAGLDFTLPAIGASDVGVNFKFVVTTTITSNNFRVTAQAGDFLNGALWIADFDTANTGAYFAADGSTHLVMTMNGGTKGGKKGTVVTFTAVSATQWFVEGTVFGDGALATPFS